MRYMFVFTDIMYIPSVVPAECMIYLIPVFLRSRWIAAISCETDAVGVPLFFEKIKERREGEKLVIFLLSFFILFYRAKRKKGRGRVSLTME